MACFCHWPFLQVETSCVLVELGERGPHLEVRKANMKFELAPRIELQGLSRCSRYLLFQRSPVLRGEVNPPQQFAEKVVCTHPEWRKKQVWQSG